MSAITRTREVPLRVDFAGGWLDVPKFARPDGFIVNCAVSPLVSIEYWPYEKNAGLGGSAAWSLLNGKDPVETELAAGAGWQDPAVIQETGLCIWRSGKRPLLEAKGDVEFLRGHMALYWTGLTHITAELVDLPRNYHAIESASRNAARAVVASCIDLLMAAVGDSYIAQLDEGMDPLPLASGAPCKYCGAGWGGYALYLFQDRLIRDRHAFSPGWIPIEPYIR